MTGTKMLIVFEDDGCLHVYESPEAAALAIEGLDAEDTIRAAFVETGVPFGIRWIRPNTEGRLLGVVPWAGNGEYTLVATGPPDRAALLAAIESAEQVFPPEASAAIAELAVELRQSVRSS
jgi:hypothetical protein